MLLSNSFLCIYSLRSTFWFIIPFVSQMIDQFVWLLASFESNFLFSSSCNRFNCLLSYSLSAEIQFIRMHVFIKQENGVRAFPQPRESKNIPIVGFLYWPSFSPRSVEIELFAGHCRGSTGTSSVTVKRQKHAWSGHVTRYDSLSKAILRGTSEGGRRHGRQRKYWMGQHQKADIPVHARTTHNGLP